MDVFFMSVWDDARRGTKFYICYGQEIHGNYHTDTLPLFFLPDSIATQNDPSATIGELWRAENLYHLPIGVPSGKQFFAPTAEVFSLLSNLRQDIARLSQPGNIPIPAPLPTVGGGESVLAWATEVHQDMDGNRRVAVDIETSGGLIPTTRNTGEGLLLRPTAELNEVRARAGSGGYYVGGGGGAGGSAGGGGGAMVGDWGMPGDGRPTPEEAMENTTQGRRVRRNRPSLRARPVAVAPTSQGRAMRTVERHLGNHYGNRNVEVEFYDGRHELTDVETFNARVDRGDWVGFPRIE